MFTSLVLQFRKIIAIREFLQQNLNFSVIHNQNFVFNCLCQEGHFSNHHSCTTLEKVQCQRSLARGLAVFLSLSISPWSPKCCLTFLTLSLNKSSDLRSTDSISTAMHSFHTCESLNVLHHNRELFSKNRNRIMFCFMTKGQKWRKDLIDKCKSYHWKWGHIFLLAIFSQGLTRGPVLILAGDDW